SKVTLSIDTDTWTLFKEQCVRHKIIPSDEVNDWMAFSVGKKPRKWVFHIKRVGPAEIFVETKDLYSELTGEWKKQKPIRASFHNEGKNHFHKQYKIPTGLTYAELASWLTRPDTQGKFKELLTNILRTAEKSPKAKKDFAIKVNNKKETNMNKKIPDKDFTIEPY
ncbi:MAG: hypothetical protein GOV15_03200, partial [Candidatus Diapherotrites archaeon]|nr:hypothetical protein [Candidatus Diapherotrites archaeon]